VKHAEHIAEALNARGIPTGCVTGETPKAERERLINAFKAGGLKALTNANVLTTGFDAPSVDLIVMLRPTMSPSLYVQMAGRGMRVAPGKEDCRVLDFAGVVQQHGPITSVQPPKKKGSGGEAPMKVCDNCDELVHISVMVCPACGTPFPAPEEKTYTLRNDDIMGLDTEKMEVSSWQWREHVGRGSGKEMLAVTYYGNLNDPPVTEYLTVTHEGYAGEKAMRLLTTMAERSGAMLQPILGDTAEALNVAMPPALIEYRKDGKFYRVMKREWA
jgi:DNA repair protein RadD